jgi:hypothetical protein
VFNHPRIQKLRDVSTNPLLINSCEVDRQFPAENQALADSILGDGKYKPGYERTYWEGCEHGFAVRGDLVRSFFLLRSVSACHEVLTL